MSYLSDEQSTHGSEPVELYEFTRGIYRFCYTSSTEPVTFNSVVYKPIPMQRSELELSGELGRAGIKIDMPRDVDFLQPYLISPPSEVTTLIVYRKHRAAPDGEAVAIWIGRLLSMKWGADSRVNLECEPIFTSIRRLGLRLQFSRSCGHVLYRNKCRVNAAAIRVTGIVTGLASNTVTLTNAEFGGANYFAGGYIEYEYDGRVETKSVLRNSANTLVLSGIPLGLVGGMSVDMFAGCDHTLTTCKTKFNNTLNYGGFPWIPSKNPFSSIALW